MIGKRTFFSSKLLATCAVALSTVLCLPGRADDTLTLPLTVQDYLAPEIDGIAEDRHSFYGEVGTAVVVTLVSEAFDPMLLLTGPDGELLVLNDDTDGFETAQTPVVETGTLNWLNSGIYLPLPETGTYTVQARSFSGLGGNYELAVRPATPYEVVLYQGRQVYSNYYNNPDAEPDHQTALALFQAAIAIDPDQPYAYIDSILTRLSLAAINREPGQEGPVWDADPQLRASLIADLSEAQRTLAEQGLADSDWYSYVSNLLARIEVGE